MGKTMTLDGDLETQKRILEEFFGFSYGEKLRDQVVDENEDETEKCKIKK